MVTEVDSIYHTIIIEESLREPEVLKTCNILRTKFSPKQDWHLHIIEVNEPLEGFIKKIQKTMVANKPYYFHIYDEGKTLLVIFKSKVFHLNPDNESTWQEAREYGGRKLNIPPEQLDFFPSRISEENIWYSRN